MKVIYEFSDGVKSSVEVTGELAEAYCISAGYDSDKPPGTLVILDGEKHADRKHGRWHKYTGIPVSLEDLSENGEEVADKYDGFSETESAMDIQRALEMLTQLQKFCFVEVELNGRTQQSVGDELGITHQMVCRHISAAKKKLKKFFN